MTCDSIFTRLPLAGLSVHGYDPGARGQISKIAVASSRIALLAISILCILNGIPTTPALYAIIGLSCSSILFFGAGSCEKRQYKHVVLEAMISAVCLTLATLTGTGILTGLQTGIGVAGTLGGHFVLALPFENGTIKRIIPHMEKQERLLHEDEWKEHLPCWPLRFLDIIIGAVRDLVFVSSYKIESLVTRKEYPSKIEEQEGTQGLCVLTHGLNGHPAIFDSYHSAIEKWQNKKITIYHPRVPKKGNCSLFEATTPISNEIVKWATAHPKLPIVLIGVSNGARSLGPFSDAIVAAETQNPIQAACIAGPFNGTKLMSQPDLSDQVRAIWRKGATTLLSEDIVEELSWESSCAQTVMQQLDQLAEKGVEFHFYATSADLLVTPFSAALPRVKNAHCNSTSTVGHSAIVSTVQEKVLENAEHFFTVNQPA